MQAEAAKEKSPLARAVANATATPLLVAFPGPKATPVSRALLRPAAASKPGKHHREERSRDERVRHAGEADNAVPLASRAADGQAQGQAKGVQEASETLAAASNVAAATTEAAEYTLVLLDGTWQYAREMFAAAAPILLPPTGPGILVQLPSVHATTAVKTEDGAPFACTSESAAIEEAELAAAVERTQQAAPVLPPSSSKQSAAASAPLLLRTEPLVCSAASLFRRACVTALLCTRWALAEPWWCRPTE